MNVSALFIHMNKDGLAPVLALLLGHQAFTSPEAGSPLAALIVLAAGLIFARFFRRRKKLSQKALLKIGI